MQVGWRTIGVAAACVVLANCSAQIDTQSMSPSSVTFTIPGSQPRTVAPDGSVIPPPGALELNAAPAPGAPPAGPDGLPVSGHYTGIANRLNNPGGRCRDDVELTNFTVKGDRVRFGKFTGRIRSDGSIQMQAGRSYVTGSFVGSRFTGRMFAPQPSCMDAVQLDPVGWAGGL